MGMAVDAVKRAKSLCDDVEFSPMDATRTEPGFRYRILEATLDAGATPVNIYYSTDNGHTVKIAYSFGQNPRFRDNGSGCGGTTGTTLGDAANPVICRHLHCVAYNPADHAVYACAGDHDRCHPHAVPRLRAPASPTQRVAGGPGATCGAVEHRLPMLSLSNVLDTEDLRAWHARVTRLLERERFAMVCEPKIDGLAIALVYERGRLVQGATRGD